ncbi:hypothetical protein F4806DRAFT_458588 [Annulohypoxylon nitens]|nr:hypothetical protein F4806DRAFT_458588 [Annulohypoxylon nitens]
MAGIEEHYKSQYGITDQDVQDFCQRETDKQNMMAFGASWRGGGLTYKEDKIAEMLKKKSEEDAKQREDSNKEREVKWVEIMDHSGGNVHAIEIIRDRCSSENFVTSRTVMDYSLTTYKIEPTVFTGVSGQRFTCTEQADIHWKGTTDEMTTTRFYVIPDDSPIRNALIGKSFDDSFGKFLLDSNPEKSVALTILGPKKVSGDS